MILTSYGMLKQQSSLISSGLITNWDIQRSSSYGGVGTAVTDLVGINNGLLIGTNTYTSSTQKYISLDSNAANYIRTTTDLNSYLSPANTGDNFSAFVWCYPTTNGVILTELGQTTPNSGWYNSQIEWVAGTPRVAVFPYSYQVNVKIFSTHAGNGATSQYASHPGTTAEFDRLFDTSYTHTTLAWEGNLTSLIALNHSSYTSLTGAGATVPNSGDYFSVEVNGTFVPAETGTYSFAINSDDGSDLFIGGNFVVSYYGGHGMAGYQYGNVSLTAGVKYSFRARYQEYAGSEGLTVVWKRPSHGVYSLQTSELNAGSTLTSSVSAALNNWHYVGLTYNGTALKAYVNGQAAGSVNKLRNTPYNAIGKGLYYALGYPSVTNMGSTFGSTFRLGAFHVYNTALSDTDILSNYNATKAAYGK